MVLCVWCMGGGCYATGGVLANAGEKHNSAVRYGTKDREHERADKTCRSVPQPHRTPWSGMMIVCSSMVRVLASGRHECECKVRVRVRVRVRVSMSVMRVRIGTARVRVRVRQCVCARTRVWVGGVSEAAATLPLSEGTSSRSSLPSEIMSLATERIMP